MGSNTVEVTIVLNSLQVSQGKESTMTDSSVESAVRDSESGCSTNTNSAFEPLNNHARISMITVRKLLEYAILSVVIAMVWGLLALPTVFYYVVEQQQQVNASSENTTAATVANCSAVPYRGETCREELLARQACLTGRGGSQEVHIPQDINQEETALQAHQLLTVGLSFLQTSAECEAAVRPFLCLYLFGLCDSGSGQVYQPSFTECVTLVTKACAMEWQVAISTQLGRSLLPSCESFPDDHAGPELCDRMNETTDSRVIGTPEPAETQSENGNTSSLNSSRGCSDGFYLDDVCRPQCGTWKPTSNASQAVIDAFTITALCIAVICGSAFFILALLQRKQMFTFPKVIFVYMDFAVVSVASVLLIGHFDVEGLLCSSVDLIESSQNPTPFCNLSGVVYTYCLIQNVLWAFFYCLILFWATVRPFHFENFKAAGRLIYVHIAIVIIGILFPCVSSFVGLSTGYSHGVRTDISTVCGSANADVGVYTVLLPISILVAGSVSMLIVIFWILLKKYMRNKDGGVAIIATAEKKILALLLFYTFVFVASLLPYTHRLVTRQRSQRTLQDYFLCEGSRSNQPDLECNVQELVATQVPGLFTASVVIQGLLPAFLLILFVNSKCLKATVARTMSCWVTLQQM